MFYPAIESFSKYINNIMLQRSSISEAAEAVLSERGGLVHNFMGLTQVDKNIIKKVLKKLNLEITPENLEHVLGIWIAGYNAVHSYSLSNE